MTFGALIDRTFRDFLEVVSEQTAQAPISSTVATGASTVTHDDVLTPEEAARLAVGAFVEINREVMFVTAYDSGTRQLTVRREMLGSPLQEHASGDMLRIAPRYTRHTVFETLADEIDGLWPGLWSVTRSEAFELENALWWVPDVYAQDIISARAQIGMSGWEPIQVHREPKLADYPDGMPIRTTSLPKNSRVQVEYRRRLVRPTSENDTLASLGLDASWDMIVIYGALATMFAGREFERETTEYLSQVLAMAVPGVELGRRSSVGAAFLRVRQNKLDNAIRALMVEYPIEVEMHDPLA